MRQDMVTISEEEKKLILEIRHRVRSDFAGYDRSAMLGHSDEMEQALNDLRALLGIVGLPA